MSLQCMMGTLNQKNLFKELAKESVRSGTIASTFQCCHFGY